MATPTVPNGAPARNQLLYILRSAGGMIKIGISYDPEQRLRQLVTGHPFELEVAHVVTFEENLAESVERITKAILAYCATKEDGEWFDISVEGAIEAVGRARAVHEFCRKRIPPTIVERVIEKTVPVDREVVKVVERIIVERREPTLNDVCRHLDEAVVAFFWAVIHWSKWACFVICITSFPLKLAFIGFFGFYEHMLASPNATEIGVQAAWWFDVGTPIVFLCCAYLAVVEVSDEKLRKEAWFRMTFKALTSSPM